MESVARYPPLLWALKHMFNGPASHICLSNATSEDLLQLQIAKLQSLKFGPRGGHIALNSVLFTRRTKTRPNRELLSMGEETAARLLNK